MKFMVLLTILLLPTTAVFSQSSFYPLGTGDNWVYWFYGKYGGVWDSATTIIEGDTSLSGKLYKIRRQSYTPSHTDYLMSPERIDSSGTVYRWNSKMGKETLAYRFGDTSHNGWLSEGNWLRFDSCAVEVLFGRARKVLYLGEYSTVDSTLLAQRLFIDSIGYYTTRIFTPGHEESPPVLHEARINGVSYSSEAKVDLADDFYALEAGNRWSYRLSQIDWVNPVHSSWSELRVVNYSMMRNGKVYHQLSQPDVLGATFVREDSN